MRIPLEHFSAIPVFALSPSSVSPEAEEGGTTATSSSSSIASSMMSRLGVPDLGLFSSSASAGSTPSSPNPGRRKGEEEEEERKTPSSAGPTSLPVYSSAGPSTISSRYFLTWLLVLAKPSIVDLFRFFGGRSMSREETKQSLQGSLLNVCLDCREMVLQVIRAQKTAKRLNMTKSLFLNLSPVYPSKEAVF